MRRILGPKLDAAAQCEAVLRSLPVWFGIEEALRMYAHDSAALPSLAIATGARGKSPASSRCPAISGSLAGSLPRGARRRARSWPWSRAAGARRTLARREGCALAAGQNHRSGLSRCRLRADTGLLRAARLRFDRGPSRTLVTWQPMSADDQGTALTPVVDHPAAARRVSRQRFRRDPVAPAHAPRAAGTEFPHPRHSADPAPRGLPPSARCPARSRGRRSRTRASG